MSMPEQPPGWLWDAIDGLHAYDVGAVDSGIHDEALRQRVIEYVASLSTDDQRLTLSSVLRDLTLSKVALDQGYGWEDAGELARWFANGFKA